MEKLLELAGLGGALLLAELVYRREERLRAALSRRGALLRCAPVLVCFLCALLTSLHFALFPFSNQTPGTDSAVFLYIGRAMRGGALPYRDVFDHKGVLLYFIEYLGYCLGFGRRIGVWLLEVGHIFAAAWLCYKTARLFLPSRSLSCLTVFLVYNLNARLFQGGNLTEEYALPWIALTVYIVLAYFVTGSYSPGSIVAIGLGFGAVFWLRVNMVGVWGALLLAVMLRFIRERDFASLLRCALLFLAGFALVSAPVLLYHLATGTLDEMLAYYFVFNFSYTASRAGAGIMPFARSFWSAAAVSGLLVLLSLALRPRLTALWVNAFALLLSFLSASISGRSYLHYGLVCLPLFALPTALCVLPAWEKLTALTPALRRRGLVSALAALCLLSLLASPAYAAWRSVRGAQADPLREYLLHETGEEDDVLLLGNRVWLYLDTERATRNHFFYQEPPTELSPELYALYLFDLREHPSDFIIDVGTNHGQSHQRILELLRAECESGAYRLEEHGSFQVYIRTT